jgi:hypothetical protein
MAFIKLWYRVMGVMGGQKDWPIWCPNGGEVLYYKWRFQYELACGHIVTRIHSDTRDRHEVGSRLKCGKCQAAKRE